MSLSKKDREVRNQIIALISGIKGRIFALRAWIFIFKSQTATEHDLGFTIFKNDVGVSNWKNEHNTFLTILDHAKKNQKSKNKNYLLTRKEWNLVQNTNKLSKYWRQINFLITSDHPEIEQIRIALEYHVSGSDDVPTFKL